MHGTLKATTEQLICADTWRDKYRYRDEPDYDATCARVIGALTTNEPDEFRAEALAAMRAREIVPAGRILAGAGTDKRVTLINCFTSPYIQDSMRTDPASPGLGIMDALSVAAYTQQMGGGIGMDFSTLRPRGAIVHRTQSVSSGVLPFMDMWNSMCATIRSSGSRRGAMMATLRCDHPDVEDFITAKQQPGRLTNFNVSVLVTDAFMAAVASDEKWHLKFPVRRAVAEDVENVVSGGFVYKTVSARELWDKIIAATYVYAEPGVIFIDRVNQQNNLAYCEHIHCCNPCGEQMLPDNGDCNLGHVNLAVMVNNPFTQMAHLDWTKLGRAARIMVRLLDNVLDVTQWPIEEQAEEARQKRRIGLGFTGLASALQQLGVPYDSKEAVEVARTVARQLAVGAYRESCNLAKERGSFPLYDADKFCASPFVQKLDRHYKAIDGIRQHGIRNGVLLSVAPTGTTSLLVGNVSSGVEPVFAHQYTRRVRGANGEMDLEYAVYDYGYLKWCQLNSYEPTPTRGKSNDYVLPEGFVTADQLSVEHHLQMAAAAQEWVDSAISKTINCPGSMSIEVFKEVYARAYELGLKGCTTYRPDPRSGRGAVLEVAPAETSVTASHIAAEAIVVTTLAPWTATAAPVIGPAPLDKIPMQEVADGKRYRIKWPTEDCAYYIVITDYVDAQGRRRPFELFISTKSERHSEWVKAFSLLVTAIFRREGDPSFVVDELRSVFSAAGGAWLKVPWKDKPTLAPSLVAAIGLKIEEHMRGLGLIGDAALAPGHADLMITPEAIDRATEGLKLMPAQEMLDVCEHCGARAVIYAEGCATCHACGRSDCG